MKRNVCQFFLLVLSASLFVLNVHGQNNLTARATTGQPGAGASEESDRARDGLRGSVRRVRTEVVKVTAVDGKLVDNGKRVLLETAEYDLKGAKTQNQYFPVNESTPTGREVYKYDEKGNISEMTLTGTDGSLISKEVYKYDYDSMGNWVKMTTSVAVVENGRITFEPTEVTYRTIFYYLDAAMTKVLEPAANPAVPNKPANASSSSDTKNSNGLAPNTSSVPETRTANAWAPPNRTMKISTQPLPLMPDARNVVVTSSQKVPVVDSDPTPPKSNLQVSGGVLNGKAISLPAPSYPDAARRNHITGTVTVEVTVDENGKIISAKAISGPVFLREASVQAAYRAKFTPSKLSGQPVKVTGNIVYIFAPQ
jgi:TonB family protein